MPDRVLRQDAPYGQFMIVISGERASGIGDLNRLAIAPRGLPRCGRPVPVHLVSQPGGSARHQTRPGYLATEATVGRDVPNCLEFGPDCGEHRRMPVTSAGC